MARYIDAEQMKIEIRIAMAEQLHKDPFNTIPTQLAELLCEFVDDTPTADVEEVRQGYWKLCEDDSLICATEFVCSVCGESFCSSELTDKQMLEMMKYCSNCGADMTRTPKERGGEK